MDDVGGLVERARAACDAAIARLEAGRDVRWEGINARAYAARLDEAALRVTALRAQVDGAAPALAPWAAG
ncbi:hypothetical protein [Demequina phytophila]|uniref:hypothetical protein n=1 Tax=Demequina phytophila TaxID=1638981 RepID=UPI0007833933|nr:hypothetical protein [Demequina phytophila]